jgi:hypothetical protein
MKSIRADRPRWGRAGGAIVAILSCLGCAAQTHGWNAGQEIRAIRFDRAIFTHDGRIIMEGKDYGPYGANDTARLEKDRDGNVRLLVDGEVRTPTDHPLPDFMRDARK